jgi:WhiB family transcriptional regulator, redox-sensing transcriptional regulator
MWRRSHERSAAENGAVVYGGRTKGSLVSGIRPAARKTSPPSPINAVVQSAEAEARIAWVSQARCRQADPDELFVRGAAQRKAAVICRHCPVILECGADALDNRVEFGVWGGLTERQRRALLKQHPEVVSWSEFFAAQRKHRSAV